MSSALSHPAASPWAFNGVVRLTRIGTTYVLFTVVIGFAALNTGNNALYIGLTFMLGCLLLSGIASKGGLKHLEVSVEDLGEAWAGSPAEVVMRIRNRSRIWNVRDIVIVAEDLPQPALVPALGRRSETLLHVPFVFGRRGHARFTRVDFYTRYPFGLFLKKRRVPLQGDLIVYPRLLTEAMEPDRFRTASGQQDPANRPGPGSEVHSFREYARGDSMRHVYWKKSASLGRWIMKQTDLDAARTLHVIVDPYKPAAVPDEDFELMVSDATTFIHQALERGLDVILQLPDVTLRSSDWQASRSMFRGLALLEVTSEPTPLSMEPDAIVFTTASERAA